MLVGREPRRYMVFSVYMVAQARFLSPNAVPEEIVVVLTKRRSVSKSIETK